MFHAPMGRFKLELIYFYYLFFHRRAIQWDGGGKIVNKNKLILIIIKLKYIILCTVFDGLVD